jgi:hypothetical protein
MGAPWVQPIDGTLRKPTVNTPWGKVATDPSGSYVEPFDFNQPFRCPKCSQLLEPGFFAEGKCIRCGHMWKAKEGIDMLIEAEFVRVMRGGWAKDLIDQLEDKRRLQESVVLSRGGDFEEMEAHKRQISEWYNREKRRLYAEFQRRAERNAVTNNLRSQARNAGL